ncbi:type VI secretion system baseplate subunit TssF [Pseudomonas alliivorans]|uniref:type VI secretion system baseplate subunit TssF n=1 Tax=Pseudomonas alliivorans TaxID=2810613 RepID=UPI001AE7108C|nr:type VI secretion system baseplate subunit TssF [Pseudomonas alliivorans]MBP0943514.1 type VI secretion system baseplate subunit TssF [Pseudomonas alliivorans]MEE4881815.1 type VI secretion system baseplate subunit TssF [Pseudomonas alliivorans]MEE4933075.1 type VI secretion system baseplate subunit TssF [Pseudomonas alliivorans]MEE4938381.1 type VI secretion system baseplate subunit TssF [Pseudomonas alliivorans]MEE4943522.1 type VI secretion system baseplate subunit TssF [Pseudomonas alli
MNPRLLGLYNQELQHIRESAAEFAREYPKIAGRLTLSGLDCADPYVERLLEGFAYLTARVQLKLDAEYPTFTHNLLEIAYPHYLAPTPSMTVVQMQTDPNEGSLNDGFTLPRDSVMRASLGRDSQTPCEYRTSHEVTLWPLQVTQADYFGNPSTVLGRLAASEPKAKAALRITLRTGAELTFDKLALDNLPLYLHGGDEQPFRLYEQLLGNTCAVFVRQPGGDWVERLPADALKPCGFDDREAALPLVPQAFQGYRLLQEYFALPQRYLFVDFTCLSRAVQRCAGQELELIVLFNSFDQDLESSVGAEQFVPFCTPAINLFPRRLDRIHLSDRVHEHHAIADRTRPMDFEIHSLKSVTGHGTGSDQPFLPFYAVRDPSRYGHDKAYYILRREPRVLSSEQRRNGTRSNYVGSETFISLVDSQQAPYRHDLRQLGLSALCTNRDLPLFMSVGSGKTDFTLADSAPVSAIRCLAGPSRPRASHAHDNKAWRLISQLSLNYLSLSEQGQGAAALRELLRLYGDDNDAALQLQIEGLREVSSKPCTRRLPMPGPIVFGRGLEITLEFDENAFRGTGVFLLGAVFERFLTRYVSINSFTETVLRTTERGEIMRWKAKPGRRPTL